LARRKNRQNQNKSVSNSSSSINKNSKKEHLFQIEIDAAMIIFSVIVMLAVIFLFTANERNLTPNCSYLDPPIVDVIALFGSAFLIIEGMWSIVRSPASHAKQIFRLLRVLFAVAVLTMHVLQIKYG